MKFERRKEVQNASVVCRGVINKACCGLNRRWLLENSFGLDDEGLKHLGEAQMCHKRIDKCEVGHLEGDNFSLYCIDGEGNRCETSDGKVSIGCQCKVKYFIKNSYRTRLLIPAENRNLISVKNS